MSTAITLTLVAAITLAVAAGVAAVVWVRRMVKRVRASLENLARWIGE